ncbi:MAG: hypothetical protein ABI378_14065 [Chitinophagaceae bacterium]
MKRSDNDYAAYQSLYLEYSAIIYGAILRFLKGGPLSAEALTSVFLEISKNGLVTARGNITKQIIVGITYQELAKSLGDTILPSESFRKLSEGPQNSKP